MTPLLVAALVLFQPGGPSYRGQVREPNPLAPSLPRLTDKEEKEIADIIDRFIDQDTGKLKGAAASKAVADFKALGPEATFLLIEGLNKAANMEDSCPAVLIAKKLVTIINSTRDVELLDFARDLIGTGVTAKRHTVTLKDLRLACSLRKAALQRAEIAAGKKGPDVSASKSAPKSKEKSAKNMTVAELAAAAGKLTGDDLKAVLTELATRKGDQPIATLAAALGKDGDKDLQQLARTLLVEALSRQGSDDLLVWLKKGSPEVRAAAARVVGDKGYRLTDDLIAALDDSEEAVRQAARAALVQLAGNAADHGPEVGASSSQRVLAQLRWRDYWKKKN